MLNFDSFKKPVSLLTFLLAISFGSKAQVFPTNTLQNNGPTSNRINFAYLSDGYQTAQLPTFITNATTINNAVFSQTPFVQYKSFFNSYAVQSPSTDAGAKHPATASDEASSGGQPFLNPNNYYQSTFDYGSIHRLLVPLNSAGINSALVSNVPDYDQAFIVVNSPYYGGSGGSYATASTDPSSTEVAIHEIGHSFAQLADEYWAGDIYAAEKPNMTQVTNPATVKWKNWYGLNGIGIYAYGASGNPAVWFRPHQLCKMQYLGYPFCSVCAERITDRIHQLVSMIDSYLPATTSYTITIPAAQNFSVSNLQTNPATISVKWYLNGSTTPFASNTSSVSVPFASFVAGANTIRAEVLDNTTLSKSYLPAAGYVNNVTWTVTNNVIPVKLSNFTGTVTGRGQGLLTWTIENPDDLQKFDLEKSRDGIRYQSIKEIPRNGSARNFSYNDNDLYNPLSYYRLKIKERDQSTYYSNTIVLRSSLEKLAYKVYQDADNHQYHLTCTVNAAEKVSILITDGNGRQVMSKSFGSVGNTLNHDIDLSGKPAGIYYLSIFIGDNKYSAELVAK